MLASEIYRPASVLLQGPIACADAHAHPMLSHAHLMVIPCSHSLILMLSCSHLLILPLPQMRQLGFPQDSSLYPGKAYIYRYIYLQVYIFTDIYIYRYIYLQVYLFTGIYIYR